MTLTEMSLADPTRPTSEPRPLCECGKRGVTRHWSHRHNAWRWGIWCGVCSNNEVINYRAFQRAHDAERKAFEAAEVS